MDTLYGLKVVVDPLAVTRVWVYPKERFWSYEPSPETERWCRFFGFGHEVTEPCMYVVFGKTLVIHPTLLEQVKLEMTRDASLLRSPLPLSIAFGPNA